MRSLEPKIFNEKVEVLFCEIVIVLSLRVLYILKPNGYQLSLGSKQHRHIECLAIDHKSSCMLAHGYRKGIRICTYLDTFVEFVHICVQMTEYTYRNVIKSVNSD